jgi:hypothetical protein
MHEADEPDAVLDFFDSDRLTSQAETKIYLFAVETETARSW